MSGLDAKALYKAIGGVFFPDSDDEQTLQTALLVVGKSYDRIRLAMHDLIESKGVRITYTNYRYERAVRTVIPLGLTQEATEWHPGNEWKLVAFDLERDAIRHFAMKDISSWEEAEKETT